jgi:hypothetical protein
MQIQLYYSYLPASQLFKESMDILMSPEPSTSTQNHEVCVDCTILQEEVTRNNQQIQCLQNQLNTPKIENTEHAATTCKCVVLGTVLVVE